MMEVTQEAPFASQPYVLQISFDASLVIVQPYLHQIIYSSGLSFSSPAYLEA